MEENKQSSPRNSTVAVAPEIGKKLDRFCASCDITKKEFVSLSLDYFERYGINPAKHESPAQEMQKLIKRVDQVVAFQRAQERDIVRPAMEAVMSTEERINNNIKRIAESYSVVHKALSGMINNMGVIADKQLQDMEDLKQAILLLAQHMDEKNKTGLIGKLFT